MIIATEARTVDATMPNAGTPLREMRLNAGGNRPSFAAASGISAQIIVQPLSAPNPEMMTAMAMMLPAPSQIASDFSSHKSGEDQAIAEIASVISAAFYVAGATAGLEVGLVEGTAINLFVSLGHPVSEASTNINA